MILPRALVSLAPLLLAACGGGQVDSGSAPPRGSGAPMPSTAVAPPVVAALRSIALPGGGAEGVGMDYLACDREAGRLWVPAGNTGSVDVIEIATGKVTRIEGFPTAERERNGRKRVVGPSSASIGAGVVYIGNRADSAICVIDPKTLTRGACLTLDSSPDGLAYVGATRELWVTTPRDRSLTILDASTPGTLTLAAKLPLDGEPEGYAVDEGRGLFYTNLEDKDRTLVIDVRQRKVTATWSPGCGEAGPRGLALDRMSNFLFVACTDRVAVLDAGHGGTPLSLLPTGAGVDNIEFADTQHELYVGAGKAAKLGVFAVDPAGALRSLAEVPTAPGARNGVVDKEGNVYLTDSVGGRILIVPPRPGR